MSAPSSAADHDIETTLIRATMDETLRITLICMGFSMNFSYSIFRAWMRDCQRFHPGFKAMINFWYPIAGETVPERIAPWVTYHGGHLHIVDTRQ